jgi:hypothetical protein
MRMIVAALVALSLPVSTAQAEPRTTPTRTQLQQMNWNAGLIEGRQSAVSSFAERDVALTLDFYSPRAIEENWFARAENRGQSGGGGGGGGD